MRLLLGLPDQRRPSREVIGPDGYSYAFVFDSSDDLTPFTQVGVATKVDEHEGGGGVFAAACRTDAVAVRWLDEDTIEITYPPDVSVEQKRDSVSYCGRTFHCLFRVAVS